MVVQWQAIGLMCVSVFVQYGPGSTDLWQIAKRKTLTQTNLSHTHTLTRSSPIA